MPAAFPPMPSRSLPIRAVKSNSRSPSTGPPGIGPSGEYAVAGPAAAGQRASIGGKAEEQHPACGDIKHRPPESLGSGRPQTRPRREHGGSWVPDPGSRPSTPVNTLRCVDSIRPRGPQDESLISCRRGRGLAALNLMWGVNDSRSPLVSSEGTTKVCVGCSRRPVRPAHKNASKSP